MRAVRQSLHLGTTVVWSAAVAGYILLTCILTWPLPRHLQTHLPGDPSGDTGAYIWNLWIFRHELLRHGHLPFSTSHVFAYSGGADFSLHNYAPIAGALGAPLIGTLGVVGAFNVVLLALITLSGLGVFVLARRLGLGTAAAWSAGALFIASPVLTARETAHLSLVIAAPLPLFLWALLRTFDTKRVKDAALVGALVAAASYSDAYYGVYCAIMGGFLVRLAVHSRGMAWENHHLFTSPEISRPRDRGQRRFHRMARPERHDTDRHRPRQDRVGDALHTTPIACARHRASSLADMAPRSAS